MPDADSPQTRSFWTSLPGILTGVAALITALVGAATLFLTHTGGSGPTAQGGSGSPATTASPRSAIARSSPALSSDAGPSAERVVLAPKESLSVDTGLVGTVATDVYWAGDQLNIYTQRYLVETRPSGQSACAAEVAHRAAGIGYLSSDQLARPLYLCVQTVAGTVAELRVSAPDAHNRLTIDLTAWR